MLTLTIPSPERVTQRSYFLHAKKSETTRISPVATKTVCEYLKKAFKTGRTERVLSERSTESRLARSSHRLMPMEISSSN